MLNMLGVCAWARLDYCTLQPTVLLFLAGVVVGSFGSSDSSDRKEEESKSAGQSGRVSYDYM